jgi:hypothetical protein
MNSAFRTIITFSLVLAAAALVFAQAAMPKMTAVEPGEAKAGDQCAVAGENLDKANVAEIYLTDGKEDLKLEIVEQAAASIKFKVPGKAKAGRFSLMLMTAGAAPKLIEQPVKITIQ